MSPQDRPESVVRLAGSYKMYDTEDYEDGGVIDNARMVRHSDGRVSIIIEQVTADERWDLRLESTTGRSFRGHMTSPDWDVQYPASLELWVAPDDEQDWLLLGTWTNEAGEQISWSINLFAEDES
jgi:hypothetical protein